MTCSPYDLTNPTFTVEMCMDDSDDEREGSSIGHVDQNFHPSAADGQQAFSNNVFSGIAGRYTCQKIVSVAEEPSTTGQLGQKWKVCDRPLTSKLRKRLGICTRCVSLHWTLHASI